MKATKIRNLAMYAAMVIFFFLVPILWISIEWKHLFLGG